MRAQIQLDDLRVPAANLVGEEGRGYGKVLSLLSDGRIAIAALSIGIARAALDAALRYAKDREAYGKPISELQAIRFDLAEMAMQVEVARQYTMYAARRVDARLPSVKEASIAKLFASEMAEKVCSAALQVHGQEVRLTTICLDRAVVIQGALRGERARAWTIRPIRWLTRRCRAAPGP